MIYGIGLPRSGGQSLCKALAILCGECVHSPGNQPINAPAAVEVFRHPRSILQEDPDAKFILNVRDPENWLRSCSRVYHKSKDWNHPIWKYPLRDFEVYRQDYLMLRREWIGGVTGGIYWRAEQGWEPLCDFLELPIPDVPFPNFDAAGR